MAVSINKPDNAPLAALILGVGGLLPFVGLSVLASCGSGPVVTFWLRALEFYGAVILSFVGAVHWGYAIRRDLNGREAWSQYGWSVSPALLAWVSLMLPIPMALRIQALVLIAAFLVDIKIAKTDPLPLWFLQLRGGLTAIASIALLLVSFSA
jgi:hypothetical protein